MGYKATIEEIIRANGGFILRTEMSRPEYLAALEKVQSGEIVRVSAGVFALKDALLRPMADITKIVPGGILCGPSAWFHYRLIPQPSKEIHIAIKRGRKVVLPEYPKIALHPIKDDIFNLGEKTDNVERYEIPVYDIERCVCDAVKARNKIGLDLCAEVLKTYTWRKDRDIPKLLSYARDLRIASSITKYLEVLL